MMTLVLTVASWAKTEDVVTPPSDLQTEEWLLMGLRYDPTEYTVEAVQTLNIGIDGQNVYVQGLNIYMPEAWVKGTLENGQVTFAANQYYGSMSDDEGESYETYFAGCNQSWFDGVSTLNPIDVTFAVNEKGDRWTTTTVLVVNTQTEGIAGFDYIKDAVIAKPYDVPAMPKAPTIAYYSPYDNDEGYGGVSLNFSPVDVDGNPLLTSKLSYIIYKDVEKVISPIEIPVWYEDRDTAVNITEIPYNFTDNYNVWAHGYAAYFYQPSSSFNRIGVQAVYRGGDEERVSEISWKNLLPYADDAVVFDFNALDKETTPVSTSSTTAGDITENKVLKKDNVTLTISPCEGGNIANRYWVDYNLKAIQLRLYGGQLTFEALAGCVIEKMYFYASDWNDYNKFDSGDISDDLVWNGSAQKVVLTIDNSKPNTKLNKISVVTRDDATGFSSVSEFPIETLHVFDLQGREVQNSFKGMVVKQVRMSDGRVKNIKHLCK